MHRLILFRLTPAGEEYTRRRELPTVGSSPTCPRCGGERVPFDRPVAGRPAQLVCPDCTRFAPTDRKGGAR